MKEVKIVIDGKEFPVSCLLLTTLAYRLPDEENYRDLARALVDLDIPSISSGVIRSYNLDNETMDAIWEKGNLDLRRDLVKKNAFIKKITDQQAEDIIKDDDPEILREIASYAELLFPGEEEKPEISARVRDQLLAHIADHSDKSVRAALWDNHEAPLKYLPTFATYVENGLMPTYGALKMTERDVNLLSDCTREMLETIAENIDVIENKTARQKTAEFLADFSDPYIRYTLASNSFAPEKILKKLQKDTDLDVADAATASLKASEEGK